MSDNPEVEKLIEDYIRIRISKREKQTIRQAAQAMGMSMSQFTRLIVSGAAVGILTAKRTNIDDFTDRIGEFVSISLKLKTYGMSLGESDEDEDTT